MDSEKFAAAKEMTRRLEREIEMGRRAWIIFSSGNGADENERAGLRQALAINYAGKTFEFIMHMAAISTVSALGRITDPPQANRNSLGMLKSLISPIQEEISEAALHWYSHLPHSGPESELGLANRTEVATKLQALISDISQFLRSKQVSEIRKLRDRSLAHALSLDGVGATYDDIESAFRSASQLVAAASLTILGQAWEPEDFDRLPMTYANEFWDSLEAGLKIKR